MKSVKGIFHKFTKNFIACFSGVNLIWQLVAIGLTYLIVASGFDWTYYKLFHHGVIFYVMLPAAILGFLFPVAVAATLLIKGKNNSRTQNAGLATAQAAFLGWLISVIYKTFTGRVHPEIFVQSVTDISRMFRFGFLRGGIFWGWPSSHTTVAFSVALTLLTLYPESRRVKFFSMLCAIYIGLGVSVSIHWFSDFVAGVIIGSLVGIVVGKSFKTRRF